MRDEQTGLQLTFDGVFDLDEAVRTAGRLEGVMEGAPSSTASRATTW